MKTEEKQKLELKLCTEREQLAELQKQTAAAEEEMQRTESELDTLTKQREAVEAV